MNFVSLLPNNLVLTILSQYLDGRLIAKLDRAFCNASSRHIFLQLLCSEGFLLDEIRDYDFSSKMPVFIKWCVGRKVKVSSLEWVKECSSVGREILIPYLQENAAPNIQKLTVNSFHGAKLLIEQIAQFPKVKHIDLSCGYGKPEELVSFFIKAPALESVSISELWTKEVSCLKRVRCDIVRSLKLYGRFDGKLDWLPCTFPNVTELLLDLRNVGGAHHITALFPKLRKLETFQPMADVSMKCIADKNPLLTHVRFSGESFSDDGLTYLCSKCTSLELIELYMTAKITSASLQAMGRYLSRTLKCLALSFCDGVQSFSELVPCSALECLKIPNWSSHYSPSLAPFLTSCTSLRELCLDRRILDDSIMHVLAHGCPNLRQLSVVSCKGCTQAALLEIAKYAPQLRLLIIRAPQKKEGEREPEQVQLLEKSEEVMQLREVLKTRFCQLQLLEY